MRRVLRLRAIGTRDAVESSIDISKGDKFITWEKSVAKKMAKVTRWEEDEKNKLTKSNLEYMSK